MYNTVLINPAYAGSREARNVSLANRIKNQKDLIS
ncbi:type IX secretion system membrane protein PorP/SprF [Ulvibacterium sp.]